MQDFNVMRNDVAQCGVKWCNIGFNVKLGDAIWSSLMYILVDMCMWSFWNKGQMYSFEHFWATLIDYFSAS